VDGEGQSLQSRVPAHADQQLLRPGHELRIEVSSSNFPRFDRNLNTGGDNYNESQGVVAHNQVHHSTQYPSSITLSVVKR
jgi:uncharacterized protein